MQTNFDIITFTYIDQSDADGKSTTTAYPVFVIVMLRSLLSHTI